MNQATTSRTMWQLADTQWMPVSPYGWYAIGVAVFALVFSFWSVAPIPLESRIVGILIFALSAFPLARWWESKQLDTPMFELVCLSYGIQYGVILFLQPNLVRLKAGSLNLAWDDTYISLLLSLLGLGSLIAGYRWTSRLALFAALSRIDLPFHPQRRVWYFVIAFGVGLSGMLLMALGVIQSTSPWASAVAIFSSQINLALFLLTQHVYRHQPGRHWTLLLYLMLSVAVMIGLSKGMLEEVLIPVVIVFVARWQATRRFPWKVMLAGLLIFAVLEPIKGQYRTLAWKDGKATSLSMSERAAIWGQVFSGLIQSRSTELGSGQAQPNKGNKVLDATLRLDLLHPFVHVKSQTPANVPYYNGSTYSYLMVTWVPRLLWPDKPQAQQANIDFALAYNFLSEEQVKSTIIGIGHLAEAYANFGVPGVIFVMLLQGMVFAILSRLLNGPESEGGKAIYVIIMVTFLQGIVSSTAGMFGGIIQSVIANTLILRLFSTGFHLSHNGLQRRRGV